MVGSLTTPSFATIRDSFSKRRAWLPGLRQTLWSALVLVLIVLVCIGASASIIIVSDKQDVASWKVQPTVLLAVLSSVLNLALSAALSISVAITWWRSVFRGTTLAQLHYIWGSGEGRSFIPALIAGFDARKVALAAAIVAMVEFVNNPLLQRATHIRTLDILTDEPMMLDLAQRLPDGWTGIIQNATTMTMIGSRHGLSTVQEWYWNDTITSRNIPGYYCNGTCAGKVRGAGISYSCSSTTETLDLSTTKNDGSIVFAINTTMSETSTGLPFLLLTTLHSSAVNDSCIATLSVDTCQIEASIVEYPVTIQDSTVTLNSYELQDMTVVSTYTSAGDLSTAPMGAGAGPLQGLNDFFGTSLYANISEILNTYLNRSIYIGPGMIADLFFDPESSSYNNHTFATCGLKWSSPTEYVLDSMHDFMFRAALRVGNGTETQTFTAQRSSPALLFHSDYRYLAAALAVMLFALLAVIFLLWGRWEFERPVNLSPLEIAIAFEAPMMPRACRSSAVKEILEEIGKNRVKYNNGGIVPDGSGIILEETEKGDEEEARGQAQETELEIGEGGKTGERVGVIDERVSITDDRVSVTGERVSVTGERVSVTGERASVTGESGKTGERVSVTGEE
jgi:Protein of unknown function (DUF3176)